MSTTVRIFAIAGAVIARSQGQQRAEDSFLMDKLPYLERWNITCTDSAATSTGAMPDHTDYVLIQVEPGKRVFYELNNSGNAITADTSSPFISDDVRVKAGPGHTLSFRDYPVT